MVVVYIYAKEEIIELAKGLNLKGNREKRSWRGNSVWYHASQRSKEKVTGGKKQARSKRSTVEELAGMRIRLRATRF